MHEGRDRAFAVWIALAAATLPAAALLCTVQWLTGAERASFVLAALGGWIALVALGWSGAALPLRPVLASIALVAVCAIVTPSHQSKDVYSYVMYGRMVTVHHASPYDNTPVHFEGDPMRRHVSQVWQRTPDVYGPVFTAVMVALAPVIGTSLYLTHFLYQLVAAIVVALLLWLLWRRTRNPVALAFVGLQPLFGISVVNGGHPDTIIAVAFFVGYLLVLERRVVPAACAFAVGIGVNFSVAVVVAAVAAWAWRKWSRREVVAFAAVAFGIGALPYALLTGWLQNAHEHQQIVSRQSVWNPIGSALGLSGATLKSVMPPVTTVAAGLLLLAVLWLHTRSDTPAPAIVAATAAFLVTSPWVMPWYAFAALPFIALRKPDLLGWTVAIYSALILVGDQFQSLSPQAAGSVLHTVLQNAVPAIAAVLCVVAILRPPAVARRAAESTAAPVLAKAG